jgi:hypothetical protein
VHSTYTGPSPSIKATRGSGGADVMTGRPYDTAPITELDLVSYSHRIMAH